MERITRRQVLRSVGLAAGTGLLGGGCAQSLSDQRKPQSNARQTTGNDWTYVELDPAAIAETAYDMYPHGSCMYAVVGSIVRALAERVGGPFRSFPFEMMRYGHGGVGGWGSICGAANGAAAVIGILYPEKDKQRRDRLIGELFCWYESAELPRYRPATPTEELQIAPSRADSVLCHVAVSKWCAASGFDGYRPERKERCRRLTADVAMKTVELLNRELTGQCSRAALDAEVKSCIKCHGQQELGDSVGKMRCSACHTFPKKHP